MPFSQTFAQVKKSMRKRREKRREPYVYGKLERGNIRLLEFVNVAGAHVECHLKTVALADCPIYQALSYCWGNVHQSQMITVDGKGVSVTPNLLSAMQAVFNFQAQRQMLPLWIDAICINQDDNKEKEEQVREMHDVYRQSEHVLVWLGREDDASDLAMGFFQWISLMKVRSTHALDGGLEEDGIRKAIWQTVAELESRYNLTKEHLTNIFQLLQTYGDRKDFLGDGGDRIGSLDEWIGVPAENHALWKACCDLSQKSWFDRVWTAQEILLAKKAIILCGYKFVCDWDTLRWSFSTLMESGFIDLYQPIISSTKSSNFYSLLLFYDSIRQTILDANDPDSFCLLIGLMGGRQATDPLDYIYGLLGMVDEGTRSKIAIDYSNEHRSNYAQLWMKAAKLAFLDNRPAELFSEMFDFFGAEVDSNGNVASWCPNLSVPRILSFVGFMGDKDAGRRAEGRRSELRGRVTCSWEHDWISVDAFTVDVIDQIYAPSLQGPAVPRDHEELLTMSEALLVWIVFTSMSKGEPGSWSLGYLHTMLAANIDDGTRDNHWSPEKLRLLFARIVSFLSTSIQNLQANRNWGLEQVLEVLGDENEAEDIMFELNRIVSVYYGQALIITRSGRFGIAPDKVRQGDHLFIVPWAHFVYVLSPDTRRLLGHACVDGLMQGQVFEMYDRGEVQLETLQIH